jgi:hypothetical protein
VKYPWFAELWRACPIPLGLVLLALTRLDPVLGIFFSTHGGLGWLLALAAFPWALARAGYIAFSGPAEMRAASRRKAGYVLLLYIAVAALACLALVALLAPPLNLGVREVLPWFFFPLAPFAHG